MMIMLRHSFQKLRRLWPAPSAADYDLYIGAVAGDLEKMQNALQAGAWVNRRHKGCGTALMVATLFQIIEAVQFLLKNGADPNIGIEFGDTALQRAKQKRDGTIERLLIEAGARR